MDAAWTQHAMMLEEINGGSNAMPALMLLSEVMERYKFDHPPKEDGNTRETLPCDIFSMTIGSGHGG
ncbi:hypothetical protein PIIN_11589 [Serendipita indica DSM 11827]|uniref:Uncharacterized protein n=1 Tax=Serendipita indica (strain DSM 11827) TaxID=1109443 RepID=G4U219_SERID|nr:hypothetical protein PIIN_11589 [Serendipita indica DSM 11827]